MKRRCDWVNQHFFQSIPFSFWGKNSCCTNKTSFLFSLSSFSGIVKCITSDRYSRFRPSNKHIQQYFYHHERKKIKSSIIPDGFLILPTICKVCLEPSSRSCIHNVNFSRNSRRHIYIMAKYEYLLLQNKQTYWISFSSRRRMYFSIVWSVTCHHFTTTLALLFFHSKYTIGLIPIFWPVKENFWKDKRICFSLHFRCRLSHTHLLDIFLLKVEPSGMALTSTSIVSSGFRSKPPMEMRRKLDGNSVRSPLSMNNCNQSMRRRDSYSVEMNVVTWKCLISVRADGGVMMTSAKILLLGNVREIWSRLIWNFSHCSSLF